MKKAALITIHGMGRTERNYYDNLRTELMDRLGRLSRGLHFGSIYYQDILQANQERVWKAARQELKWHGLRKFLLYGFGDAAALETYKQSYGSAYTDAQVRIAKALYGAYIALGEKDRPVVIVAHSLGGQVISNYLWDAQQPNINRGFWQRANGYASVVTGQRNAFTQQECGFLKGDTILYLYTTGCNIPVFVAGHGTITPIRKTHDAFEWHNFYDPDDALGWPLEYLSASYAKLVMDHRVNVSAGFLSRLSKSWNPFAHGLYWRDKGVLRHLASRLKSLL